MNSTGITLSWQDLFLAITGMTAVVSYVAYHVRSEAKRDYEIKCERDRNDEQDKRMAAHDIDMKEMRKAQLDGQKQLTKLLDGMHGWWIDRKH